MSAEVIRLLMVLLFTLAGYEVAAGNDRISHPLGFVALGVAFGYVVGGLLGRRLVKTVDSVEARAARASAPELLAGAVGALLLGALAAVMGIGAVGVLPGRWGWPVFALITWIGAFTGYRIATIKAAELLHMAGLSVGPLAPPSQLPGEDRGDALLLDTSVLLDGRLIELARTGFLRRDLLVPAFVLDELQSIADSQDTIKRRKGRRGLEILEALRRDRRLRIHVPSEELPEIQEVDAKLIALAQDLGVSLMTNDQALSRVAEVRGVQCLSLARLAQSLRPSVIPGELVQLSITREGLRPGEGVGFLDDGSRVVVGDAGHLIGQQVEVRISSSLQTPGGRMLFASLSEA